MRNRFDIINCLKKDSHSSVYLARNIATNQQIILKTLDTRDIQDPAIIKRFQREARILTRLDHPNIIKIFAFDADTNEHYISSEYFESKTLRNLIREKKLNASQKISLAAQLLQGLAFAHNNQIIHRDIKPENILVNRQNQLKIADFGLALIQTEDAITRKSTIVGTPGYMSPEQIRGEKLSPQSDLFSAGTVIYELFTGKQPFIGKDISETINNILQKQALAFPENDENIPAAIIPVLKKALEKDRAKRYTSTDEMLADFPQEFLTTPEIAETPGKLRSFYVAAIFLVFLTVVFFSFQSTFFSKQAKDFPQNQAPAPDSLLRNQENRNLVNLDTSASVVDPNNPQPQFIRPETQAETLALQEESILPVAKTVTPITADSQKESPFSATESIETTAAAADLPGNLMVQCLPWAEVFIDSQHVNTTPFDTPLRLSPGEYLLRLKHPEYPDYQRKISLLSGQQTTIQVDLDTTFGYLNCLVYPWADIYLNQKHYGQTPLTGLKLANGQYQLAISNPHFASQSVSITISSGDTLYYRLNLEETLQQE